MSTATKISADALFDIVKNRRTIYPLNKDLPISAERVQEIVREATLHTPSAFNSQSNRAVVLLGAEHERLWDMTSDVLKAIVPAESWQPTADKMAMFRAAAGTVLFFADQDVVAELQAQWAPYADKFPVFATETLAMQQFLTWTALEAEGLGANLQHYNPLVDEKIQETWKVPSTWKLAAQLVFGGKAGEAGDKLFKPVEDRVKVYGA
jgi:predicted oxidoreductase (fatty acid repression mutant protein)